MLYILSKLFKSAEDWFNSTVPACISGNNFKLLLATIEQFNFETLLKYSFNSTLNLMYWAYKPCQSEFSVSKEKGHFTL